jgi:hypothetical protein
MQLAAGALGSALVSVFHTGTALPMAGMLLVSAVVRLTWQSGYMMDKEELDSRKPSVMPAFKIL